MEVLSNHGGAEGFHVKEGAHKMGRDMSESQGDCDDFLAACMGGALNLSPASSNDVELPREVKEAMLRGGANGEAAEEGNSPSSCRLPLWKRMQNLQALEPTYYKFQPSPCTSPGTSPSGVLDAGMMRSGMGSGTFSDTSMRQFTPGGGSSPIAEDTATSAASTARKNRRRSKLLEDLETVAVAPVPGDIQAAGVPWVVAPVVTSHRGPTAAPGHVGDGSRVPRRRSQLATDIDHLMSSVPSGMPVGIHTSQSTSHLPNLLNPPTPKKGPVNTSVERRRSRLLQDLDTAAATLSPNASYLDVPSEGC